MVDFDVLKNMKSVDKARAFDVLIEEYRKAADDPQRDVKDAFTNTLDWCSKWFGGSE